ncbi:MAG: thioredoxin domain-containing protein [Pseudomonadota bacterium]
MSAKKEEQRKHREELQAAAVKKQKWRGMAWKAGLVLFIPLVLYVFLQGLFTGSPALPPDVVSEADHVRGNPDAKLTLTVYADFQCPACLTETEVISRAWIQISDKVKLVFRHYPLDVHNHAFLAARYAEAAGRQGKFWEMHDVLYGNQELWTVMEDPTETFVGYAKDLELNLEQLKADADLVEVRNKILADQRGGTRNGVRGTPSLFFNGRLVNNPQSASELVQRVNAALEDE